MSKKSKPKHTNTAPEPKPAPQNGTGTENFYLRHDYIFTLLGTLLVFATFIAKETIGEHYKDSLEAIEKAQDLFLIREEFANALSDTQPRIFVPSQPLDEPNRQQALDSVTVWIPRGRSLANAAFALSTSLDDAEARHKKADDMLLEIDYDDQLSAIKDQKPPSQVTFPFDNKLQKLYAEGKETYKAIDDFHTDVYKQAELLRQKRENYVAWAQWISWIAFIIGSAITFYGQLSAKPAEPPKQAA
jgi:hypothetical protein